METPAHRALKDAAARFLIRAGCQAVATEVRCPRSRYRVDAAGYLDARPVDPGALADDGAALSAGTIWAGTIPARRAGRALRCEPRTAIVECKQSRADFLKDSRETVRLLRRRDALEQRRAQIEDGLIKPREPHLRESGVFLFTELENWAFEHSDSIAYRRVLRSLRRVNEQLYAETKFWLAAQYRLADRLYLLAPAGLIERRELPTGWGLVECDNPRPRADPAEPAPWVSVTAPHRPTSPDQRARLLRNIAVAATRTAWKGGPPGLD
ncbi:MAG TPA: hypothetical protein DEB06_02205 [Phycisphaerales bacterium]|nr:hypothetical protein [Phycisphaerales bacterium]